MEQHPGKVFARTDCECPLQKAGNAQVVQGQHSVFVEVEELVLVGDLDALGEVLVSSGLAPTITFANVIAQSSDMGNVDEDPLSVLPGYWADPANRSTPMPPTNANATWIDDDC
jgi:hypothetical protein